MENLHVISASDTVTSADPEIIDLITNSWCLSNRVFSTVVFLWLLFR